MGIAYKLGTVDRVQFWPDCPVTLFRFEPPLQVRNATGEVTDTHDYGIAYVQPEFSDSQDEEAILYAADETGWPKGRTAKPIGRIQQAAWRPDFDALMFTQGYTISEEN